MAVTLQFVDKIDASPTVRLDLNTGSWRLQIDGTDFGFPELNRAIVSTLLQDGGQVPAAAYGLRTLTLRFVVDAATADANATAQQSLYRELARSTNFLKYQPETTAPVFFKTLRSSPDNVQWIKDGADYYVTVPVLAEPFAYGLKETPVSAQTFSADPSLSNGCRIDINTVKGDVETPTVIKTGTLALKYFGTRRRGTPSNATFVLQAEAMTQGTDTTTQANSVTFSGTGNNYSRCTFGTDTGMTIRLSKTVSGFGTASADLRGTYRVFCRYRTNSSTTVSMKITWGGEVGDPGVNLITNDTVTGLETGGATELADLGLISVPFGGGPETDQAGSSLVTQGVFVKLWVQRTAGSGTVDIDYLFLMPADDRLGIVDFEDIGGSNTQVYDAANTSMYALTSTSQVVGVKSPKIVGGFPFLTPGQNNRVYFLDFTSSLSDYSVTVEYHPRYLHVRPSAT